MTIVSFAADAHSSLPLHTDLPLLSLLNQFSSSSVKSIYCCILKMLDCMSDPKLKQLQYESDTWKRLLGFMMDENVHLKNRLSEILMDGFDRHLLAEAENFLNRFIKEDDMVGLIRHDVGELDKLLVREIFENGQLRKEVINKIRKLRNNIKIAEQQFRKLKTDFNGYLSVNI